MRLTTIFFQSGAHRQQSHATSYLSSANGSLSGRIAANAFSPRGSFSSSRSAQSTLGVRSCHAGRFWGGGRHVLPWSGPINAPDARMIRGQAYLISGGAACSLPNITRHSVVPGPRFLAWHRLDPRPGRNRMSLPVPARLPPAARLVSGATRKRPISAARTPAVQPSLE